MSKIDVLVVGGGPAGASLAFALARRGIGVRVVDRARFPRPKPCAEYLSPEASRILADMGALELIEQTGAAALAGIHVRAPNGNVIKGDFIAGLTGAVLVIVGGLGLNIFGVPALSVGAGLIALLPIPFLARRPAIADPRRVAHGL